jgi:hypothetical protein
MKRRPKSPRQPPRPALKAQEPAPRRPRGHPRLNLTAALHGCGALTGERAIPSRAYDTVPRTHGKRLNSRTKSTERHRHPPVQKLLVCMANSSTDDLSHSGNHASPQSLKSRTKPTERHRHPPVQKLLVAWLIPLMTCLGQSRLAPEPLYDVRCASCSPPGHCHVRAPASAAQRREACNAPFGLWKGESAPPSLVASPEAATP